MEALGNYKTRQMACQILASAAATVLKLARNSPQGTRHFFAAIPFVFTPRMLPNILC